MTRKRLKDWVLPLLSVFVAIGAIFCYFLLSYIFNYDNQFKNSIFTTDVLIEDTVTVNEEINSTIIKPFKELKSNIVLSILQLDKSTFFKLDLINSVLSKLTLLK